jgi:hypothetical protein
MAYAIVTTGAEIAILDSAVNIAAGEDFSFKFVINITSASRGHIIGKVGELDNTISLRFTNNSNAYVEFDGVGTVLNYSNPLVIGSVYSIEVKRTLGFVDIVDNSTGLSLLTAPKLNDNSFSFDEFFAWGNGGNKLIAQTQSIELTSASANHKWDATASDHDAIGVQPDLIDTINGNTARGGNFLTDGSAWINLGGTSGEEQSITAATTEQITQSEIVEVIGIGFANAIVSESITQSQLVNINEATQLNAVLSEQKSESSLQALATINNVSPVICEQLNVSETVSNEATQLVYAVQAQQLTQSLSVNVSGDGTQSVNVIVTEQKAQSQAVTLEEAASIQAVTCEQLAQAINANVSEINETNAITAEQLSQSITVSVDESSGVFVSVVHTEQLSQSTLADINADSIINAVITQQLTQTSTQSINVDITLDAVICEQLTHAELITIIEQNISQQLSIDVDQITIEILTPTHEIEMLTPQYTIEHLH